MSSLSPHQQSLGLTDSPVSSLSSPSSPSFPDTFPSSSNRPPQTTVYDILHNPNNPPEFYGEHPKEHPSSLVTSGCTHLAQFKKQRRRTLEDEVVIDDDDRWDLLTSYRSLVHYSLAWHKSRKQLHSNTTTDRKRKQYKELPLPQCSTCLDPLSRLHVCLHCVYMGCWRKGHIQDHMREKHHVFAMDFNHRTLYCNECGDYVYDNELTDTIVRQETIQSESRRRKRVRTANTSWEPTSQDMSAIVKNSTVPSCRGIRGLCNMGNTCFMNVILQSFIHNPLLKAYFLSDQHNPSRCNNKFCLCCEMDNLYAQVYSGKKEPYGPCTFLHSMWMSLKELAGYAQQDAHEFFISALNNLHAGCEGHSLSTNCTCIVHRTFAGLLQSNVTCLKCGNVTSTMDPMLDISLSLRPVEKKKKSLSNNKVAGTTTATSTTGGNIAQHTNNSNNPASFTRRLKQGNSLMDCLDRYTHPEKLGQNEYSCSKCGNTFQEATKQLSVKRLPPVLSFQLKRFEHGISASKIEAKIKFPVELDMTPYTTHGKQLKSKNSSNSSSSMNMDISNQYTLFAVINHHGKIDSGHYTMFSKHRGEWFKFEDHNVTTTFQKDVLDSKA
ncbi:hypothetical protein BDA99DRAFT_553451 [Phascolomyces articulosus]|uniref:Ubiquitin carboxyl-terminal hydrolase n=1 Tax=Phascolomyces articulosus TaxID=60185 RepID=A0AAD5P8P6_9FUNG|nr:hypothetical protein BDA99DRAFT_553451 [Phascolomyces articulosus]